MISQMNTKPLAIVLGWQCN